MGGVGIWPRRPCGRLAGVLEAVEFGAFAAWAAAPVAAADEERAAEAEPAGDTPDVQAGLRHFWQSEYGQMAPIAVEQEFHVRLGGAVIRGFIDRVHRRPDGTLEVVDLKIGVGTASGGKQPLPSTGGGPHLRGLSKHPTVTNTALTWGSTNEGTSAESNGILSGRCSLSAQVVWRTAQGVVGIQAEGA